MKDIPLSLILEKNKVATSSAWLILLKITFPTTTDILYLVNNNEDITFESVVYTASSFKLAVTKQNSKSQLENLQIQIVNVDRIMQQKVEEYNGGEGSVVDLTVVNTSYLNPTTGDVDLYKELERTYDVIGCSSDEQWVTFTLGAPNPLQVTLPLREYSTTYCQNVYKDVFCAYTGAEPTGETTCNLTLADCKLRSNQMRFGGHLGMNTKAYGFRV